MTRLLTVYDSVDPLNNVISALTIKAEKVFFIYHHHVSEYIFENIRAVLGKYYGIKAEFIRLVDDDIQISEILDKNKKIVVDVGGATYLSLLLFEMVRNRDNQIIYYDDDENCIKDYRTHTVINVEVFKLQIEDVLTLRGGEIKEHMHHVVTDKETKKALVTLVENNIENYSSFIRYITKINSILNNREHLGSNTYQLKSSDIQSFVTDNEFDRSKELFEIDEENRLTFKTGKLREMVSISGAFLENYLYIKLKESGLFDDIKMSTVIDFSDDKYSYPVRCEIDCLIIKNNRLLFVSCKSTKADATALNEIYVHNSRFGNALSLPVLCVCEELDRKYPSTYAKGEELGIYIVDRSSFLKGNVAEVFASILDGTYEYDDVTKI